MEQTQISKPKYTNLGNFESIVAYVQNRVNMQ